MSKFLLKFENTANVGDLIKAYDFEPIPGRTERYVIGRVIRKGDITSDGGSYKGYVIEVVKDTAFPKNAREIVAVPYEVSMFDYDNRVSVVTEEVAA